MKLAAPGTFGLIAKNHPCLCSHRRGRHFINAHSDRSPCRECGCTKYQMRPLCKCTHAQSAHTKNGGCSHGDKCSGFEPQEAA